MDWIDELREAWAREYPDVDTSTLTPMTRLIRLGVLMNTFQLETLEPFGLTAGDYNVISTLRRLGPPYRASPSDLYSELEWSSGGMTKLLKRLEKLELINRSPDPKDGRGTLVTLTLAGIKLQEEIFKVFLTRTEELLISISPGELSEINQSLKILLEAIESHFYR